MVIDKKIYILKRWDLGNDQIEEAHVNITRSAYKLDLHNFLLFNTEVYHVGYAQLHHLTT
jgi:hypothetical protein